MALSLWCLVIAVMAINLKLKNLTQLLPTWDLLGSSSLSATTTTYFAADIDSSGNPYVAYVDQGNSNKVDIKKFNGSIGKMLVPTLFYPLIK